MSAKLLQLWPTLCNAMDCRPPGFSILGILQARILEWVAMPSSRGSSPFREASPLLLCLLNWQAGSLPLAPPGKPSKILTPLVKSRWVSIVPACRFGATDIRGGSVESVKDTNHWHGLLARVHLLFFYAITVPLGYEWHSLFFPGLFIACIVSGPSLD